MPGRTRHISHEKYTAYKRHCGQDIVSATEALVRAIGVESAVDDVREAFRGRRAFEDRDGMQLLSEAVLTKSDGRAQPVDRETAA